MLYEVITGHRIPLELLLDRPAITLRGLALAAAVA